MSRGKPNPKLIPPPMNASPSAGPAPLIILQPSADGTRVDAYGLSHAECIDELRRALIHLVAMQSGVQIISTTVSHQAAVVAQRSPVPQPSPNGTGPRKSTKAPVRRLQASHDDDDDYADDIIESRGRATVADYLS